MSKHPAGDDPAGLPPLRVALVGYGLAGSVFHAPLVRSTPGMQLTTVVTADPGRQARCRADNPGTRVVAGVGELVATPADHDLVVVATPTASHLELGLQLVAARLPLVVDKPLAATAADARTLVDAAAQAGVFLSTFHNRRWDSDTLTIERLVAADLLGRVTRFESRFERWRPAARAGAWREELPVSQGGGIVLDLGSHVVDQALHLFGPPVRVYAEIAARRPGSVEDDAFIALEHRDGVMSHLWVSAVAALRGPRVRVLGMAGAYVQPQLDGQEDALRGGASPAGDGWGREAEDRWGELVTREGSRRIEPERGDWPAFYAGVAAALRGTDGANPVSPASAVEVLEVIDAARRSATDGVVVELG